MRAVLLLLVDEALHILEVRDLARNGDGALLLKSIFLLGFVEEFLEQRMVYIHCRYYKTLMFFSFTAHVYRDAALWNILVKIVRLLL